MLLEHHMSILRFISDFNKVEIAFYFVFDHRTKKFISNQIPERKAK